MNCHTARERIMEADPADLHAGPDCSLTRHLSQCPECRAAAARLVDGMTVLSRELAVAPARPVEVALARLRHHRSVPFPRLVPWAAAAAAGLGTILLFGPWHEPAPVTVVDPAVPSSAPVVEDAGGARVAMFATTNPRITVVWLYEENTR